MDILLLDGDQALFLPTFGPATVVVRPGQLTGSGPATVGGKPICVEGDQCSVSVSGCMYVTPQYSIPGSGVLEIAALAADHRAGKTHTGGMRMLLVGGAFDARFKVQTPAQQPPPGLGPPIPDSTPFYSGRGNFVSANRRVRGS